MGSDDAFDASRVGKISGDPPREDESMERYPC